MWHGSWPPQLENFKNIIIKLNWKIAKFKKNSKIWLRFFRNFFQKHDNAQNFYRGRFPGEPPMLPAFYDFSISFLLRATTSPQNGCAVPSDSLKTF